MCKECLEIFQEFQTTKRSDGPSLNSDPIGCEPSSVKLRNVSNSLQKNPGEATAGGADASNLLRAGSGNYSRSTRPMTVLSPHKSWDDASSGRSQDDSPSILRMNVGFDNPAPMRSISGQRESFESLHEREERLMALNEVGEGGREENICNITTHVHVHVHVYTSTKNSYCIVHVHVRTCL